MKINLLFTITLTTLFHTGFSQSGLLGSYPFNGNANDVSGNGNNGTVSNAVLTSDRFGNPNSAYLFNGTNSYIDLGNNFSYSSHSFSCWARRDSATGNTLVSKINNGPYDVKNSEFSINAFTIGNGSTWLTVNSIATPNYAQWNCYVATYDATTNEAKLYVNGVADSMTLGTYFDVNNTPIFIGARPYWNGTGGPAFFFKGAIDEVNIYNRVLTQQEVDSLCPTLTAVNTFSATKQLSIYPNPFSTQTTLWTASHLNNATLTVDNIFGQTVAQIKNINGQTVIFSRDNLLTGLYFLRLTQDNKVIATDKLVIVDN